MRKLIALGLLGMMLVGCGNPGGLSDIEYTAQLRNKREARERQEAKEQAAYETKVLIEQLKQKEENR